MTSVIPGLAVGENPEPTTGLDAACPLARVKPLTRSWVPGSSRSAMPRNDEGHPRPITASIWPCGSSVGSSTVLLSVMPKAVRLTGM
jgi:hypothetical protein